MSRERRLLERSLKQQKKIGQALESLAPLPGLLEAMQTRLEESASQAWVREEL